MWRTFYRNFHTSMKNLYHRNRGLVSRTNERSRINFVDARFDIYLHRNNMTGTSCGRVSFNIWHRRTALGSSGHI